MIQEAVGIALAAEGRQMQGVTSIAAAKVALAGDTTFDVVLLDIGLPDGDGLTFCRWLRASRPSQPILFLTARVDEESAVAALGAGGDDFLRKPFGMRELLARAARVYARVPRPAVVRYGPLAWEAAEQRISCHGKQLRLSRREYTLLALLIERGGRLVTREALLDRIDGDGNLLDRTLDSHLSHLRQRLREANAAGVAIVAEYGMGYRLLLPP